MSYGFRNDCNTAKAARGSDARCIRCTHAMDDHQEDGCLGCKPTLIESTRPRMHDGKDHPPPEHPNCRCDTEDPTSEHEGPLAPW